MDKEILEKNTKVLETKVEMDKWDYIKLKRNSE
jgi:hypothetical protein